MMSSYEVVAGEEDSSRRVSSDSPRSSVSSIFEKISTYRLHGSYKEHSDRPDLVEEQWDENEVESDGIFQRKKREVKSVRKVRLITIGALLVVIIFLLSSTSISYFQSFRRASFQKSAAVTAKNLPTLQEMRTGTYAPSRKSISWIDPVPGSSENLGDYVIEESDKYLLTHWADRSNQKLIVDRVVKIDGKDYVVQSISLNKQQTKAILTTNKKKNWRHSSFALFWILDLETRDITPVNTEDPSSLLSLAEWSPRGDRIAFIWENNLYLRYVGEGDGVVKQITIDGGDQIFYGRPDWVYEEEVFGGAKALWWSLNGEYLAFLRTNDTEVPEFPIPYFVQHGKDDSAYPDLVNIKYPKPGFPNPIVNILFLEIVTEEFYSVPVEENGAFDNLITEVVWTDNSKVIVRLTTRESDVLKISVVDAKTRQGKIVREQNETGENGGWFEVSQNTIFVPADPSNGRPSEGYIDTIAVDGYNHLAFFSPLDSSTPKQILTSGKWEVDSAPSSFDSKTNKVYFVATEKSAVERHLYEVYLDGTGFSSVTDRDQEAFYRVSFSADSRYVLLNYEGPSVPWQKVLDLQSVDPLKTAETIESNHDLRDRLKDYALPTVNHFQLEVAVEDDGTKILANVKEILPASFDPEKKYPVLFYVYGGPGSQQVTKVFGVDFQQIISGLEDTIVVTIDGRGTGFMGRKFRNVVRDQLGHFEPIDQITAAKYYANKSFVDEERIAIWGWSYGGYMTLKTLETDAGNTFRYGMSVAPVTDWRFYDSVYTERYMHTPQKNPEGYDLSAIHNATAIGQNERFLVMHGTGDDNVHLQNTLVFLDLLDQANIENYDVHVFPDSDHSISYHNANAIVYDKLSHWISDAFNGNFKKY